jgi:predicted O-methyltransferase YrrM
VVDQLALARSAAASIEGWLTDGEGTLLFSLAAACPADLAIVEIGSWKGKSTVWIARGSGMSTPPRVFAIDPHQESLEDPSANTLADLRANLERAGVAQAVQPIVALSHDAAGTFRRTPGFVFVDGSHLEEAARQDLDDWLPKLAQGGAIALHDVLNERWTGPRRALRSLLWTSTELEAVRFTDSIAWTRRVPRASVRDRYRNRVAALLLAVYEIRSWRLPGPVMTLLQAVYRRTSLKRRQTR